MKTHRGKIGRLPEQVRAELNLRLLDGAEQAALVDWLNSLPKVRAVMQAEFGGEPVKPQNLSNWHADGFQEWRRENERREACRAWADASRELEAGCGQGDCTDELSIHFSRVFAADLAMSAEALLKETPDAAARCRQLQGVLATFRDLRRENQREIKVRLAEEKWEHEMDVYMLELKKEVIKAKNDCLEQEAWSKKILQMMKGDPAAEGSEPGGEARDGRKNKRDAAGGAHKAKQG